MSGGARTVQPARLRRRLTLAFVVLAGISAAALALGSYLVVRQARLDDSLHSALETGCWRPMTGGGASKRCSS